MNCKNCRTDLIGFIRGTLTGDAEVRIREHLNGCPECRSFADYFRETLDVIRLEKEIAPDPFLATRIEGIITNSAATRRQLSFLPKLIPALTFSIFILAGVAGGIGLGSLLTPASDNQYIAAQELSFLVDDLQQEPIESFLMGL
jgi:predicted anti-sigma-YlaC factor YlaD